jgi:hypothetical protein
MSNQNETKAFQVLDTFADSRVTLIQGMKDAGYITLEECEPIVIKWACAKVGAKWQIKAEKVRFVSTHAKYNTAKTVKNDIMHMLKGTTRHKANKASNGKSEPADNVTKIIDAFNKLTPAEKRKVLKALAA